MGSNHPTWRSIPRRSLPTYSFACTSSNSSWQLYSPSLVIPFILNLVVDNSMWLWVFFIGSSSTLILFMMLARSNAGRLPKNKGSEIIQLLLTHDNSLICPDCQIVAPIKSKHCEVCQACIARYDHHCPWISNCVGSNNFKLFYIFLISFFISLILQMIM